MPRCRWALLHSYMVAARNASVMIVQAFVGGARCCLASAPGQSSSPGSERFEEGRQGLVLPARAPAGLLPKPPGSSRRGLPAAAQRARRASLRPCTPDPDRPGRARTRNGSRRSACARKSRTEPPRRPGRSAGTATPVRSPPAHSRTAAPVLPLSMAGTTGPQACSPRRLTQAPGAGTAGGRAVIG